MSYKSNKLRKECTDHSVSKVAYGERMAEKIAQRIGELQAAESIGELLAFKIGGCHQLKGDRSSDYAMTLVEPYRMIFIEACANPQKVKVTSIENYH